jgi:hypothetical protein
MFDVSNEIEDYISKPKKPKTLKSFLEDFHILKKRW